MIKGELQRKRVEGLRIAICDDEADQLALIGSYVEEYIGEKNLDVQVKSFSSPVELLDFERKNGGSEVYLLDIVMDMSGLELGRRIRAYNEQAVVIYLTTAREYSLDAFSVHAFSYLVKPFEKARLFDELDKAFRYRVPPKKAERFLTVKTAEGVMAIPAGRVDAVEYLDHRLALHLTDGEIIRSVTSREPFDAQVSELAAPDTFVKCADSYLVNMANIAAVTVRGFQMKSGGAFPITRKYAAARERFLHYKLGGNET